MNRERGALIAFLVLATAATAVAVVLRPAHVTHPVVEPVPSVDAPVDVASQTCSPSRIPMPEWVPNDLPLPTGSYATPELSDSFAYHQMVLVLPVRLTQVDALVRDEWPAAGYRVRRPWPDDSEAVEGRFSKGQSTGAFKAVDTYCHPRYLRMLFLYDGDHNELVDPESPVRATTCASLPLYPSASRLRQRFDAHLLDAVNEVPAVPEVVQMEQFSLGRSSWLGGGSVPDVFTWYSRRLEPIGFERIPEAVRLEIGLRPIGTVDSPELLYAAPIGAALIQGVRGGREVRLTLFCGPVDL